MSRKNEKNDIDKSSKQEYSKDTRRRTNLFSKGKFIPSIQNEQKFDWKRRHDRMIVCVFVMQI